jgi:hypothetical protein
MLRELRAARKWDTMKKVMEEAFAQRRQTHSISEN